MHKPGLKNDGWYWRAEATLADQSAPLTGGSVYSDDHPKPQRGGDPNARPLAPVPGCPECGGHRAACTSCGIIYEAPAAIDLETRQILTADEYDALTRIPDGLHSRPPGDDTLHDHHDQPDQPPPRTPSPDRSPPLPPTSAAHEKASSSPRSPTRPPEPTANGSTPCSHSVPPKEPVATLRLSTSLSAGASARHDLVRQGRRAPIPTSPHDVAHAPVAAAWLAGAPVPNGHHEPAAPVPIVTDLAPASSTPQGRTSPPPGCGAPVACRVAGGTAASATAGKGRRWAEAQREEGSP